MKTAITALEIILPFLYLALVGLFARIFFSSGDTSKQTRQSTPLILGTLAAHFSYIGLYTVDRGHCLLSNTLELSSLIAFTLFSVFAFVEVRLSSQTGGTGFLVSLVALIFQSASSLFINSDRVPENIPILNDGLFNVHVTTAVFGYAALTLATIYGALYLLLYRAITRNQFGPIFQHLPNLERLERFGIRATGVGFLFLTVSIILGWLLMRTYPPTADIVHFVFDPKILATFLVWLVFGSTLVARRVARLEGRKIVLFWMSGFALTVISMTIVNAFSTTFHNFL